MIDLRSDTVTRPTDAMRAVMARAPVGDMQYGDDPSLNALEFRVAALLGKEAALWLPSGTMANQVALRVLTRPGDDVLVGTEAHSVWHEAGGSAANAGVQFTEIGSRGLFTAEDVRRHVKPRHSPVLPIPGTTLVQIENTHNRHGGLVWGLSDIEAIGVASKELGLAYYLDGARLWNACIATGLSPGRICVPFDLVSVAFSKGLGAPAGSVLSGSRALINAAIRHRRMLGGAMRQVGMFAAACDHALTHHFERLEEDHEHARLIAAKIARLPGLQLASEIVPTNIVMFELKAAKLSATELVEAARKNSILINALGPNKVRLLTHLDVSRTQCIEAAEVISKLLT